MSGEARKGFPAESRARDGYARDLQPATRAAAAWNALNTIFTRLSSKAVILRLISPLTLLSISLILPFAILKTA